MCSTVLTYSDGTKGPPGSYKLLFVALNPSKPIMTTPILMPPELEVWRTGLLVICINPSPPLAYILVRLWIEP